MALSCVRDTASGDIILKLVSRAAQPVPVAIDLAAAGALAPTATCTTLSGDPLAVNEFGRPASILPLTAELAVESRFRYVLPPHSLTVLRLKVDQP